MKKRLQNVELVSAAMVELLKRESFKLKMEEELSKGTDFWFKCKVKSIDGKIYEPILLFNVREVPKDEVDDKLFDIGYLKTQKLQAYVRKSKDLLK